MRAQTDPRWEWCVVDDCSTRPEVGDVLDRLSSLDPRIRVHRRTANGGIVSASNDALGMATGDFVAFLDHDDRLLPTALADAAAVLDDPEHADVDYLYTDEAHVLTDGRETAHFLKPDWSPERFRASMYTCHLSVVRRDVITAVGGFRVGFDGSQDHDLILRVTEAIAADGRRVAHLPLLAYHWRNVTSSVSRATDTLDRAIQQGRRAVQEHCDRLGIDAIVEHGAVEGTYRLRRAVDPSTKVTVVLATAGESSGLRPYRLAAAATLRELSTTHPTTRLVLAHPAGLAAPLVDLLDAVVADRPAAAGPLSTDPASAHPMAGSDGRWMRLPVDGPWSLAGAIDRAVQACPADVVVIVGPGIAPRSDVSPDWVETMVGLALQPGVGLVGGLVATSDDVVLHAGWDTPNYRWYELEGMRVGTTSSGNDLFVERECSQVTLGAAAIAVAHWNEFKHTAAAATGWDEAGRALSDALVASGLHTLWTPHARFDRLVPPP